MGLFTKNNLTTDEAVDVTTHVTILSILFYLARGIFLSNDQRREALDNRLMLRGKDASWWHKSKLCIVGDDVAKHLVSNPLFLRVLDEKAWGVNLNSSTDKEVNEEIAALVRVTLRQRNLV